MVIFKQFKRESDLLLHCLQTFCLLQRSALTAQSHNNVSVFFGACQLPCTVQIHKSPSSMFNSTTCSSASNPAPSSLIITVLNLVHLNHIIMHLHACPKRWHNIAIDNNENVLKKKSILRF